MRERGGSLHAGPYQPIDYYLSLEYSEFFVTPIVSNISAEAIWIFSIKPKHLFKLIQSALIFAQRWSRNFRGMKNTFVNCKWAFPDWLYYCNTTIGIIVETEFCAGPPDLSAQFCISIWKQKPMKEIGPSFERLDRRSEKKLHVLPVLKFKKPHNFHKFIILEKISSAYGCIIDV